MKKSLIALILLYSMILVSTNCISGNKILNDTRKSIETFETKLTIIDIFYVEEKSLYVWNTVFLYKNIFPIQEIIYLEVNDLKLKDKIEKGNYSIYAKVYIDIENQALLVYPVWVSSYKKINLEIIKLKLPKNMKDKV